MRLEDVPILSSHAKSSANLNICNAFEEDEPGFKGTPPLIEWANVYNEEDLYRLNEMVKDSDPFLPRLSFEELQCLEVTDSDGESCTDVTIPFGSKTRSGSSFPPAYESHATDRVCNVSGHQSQPPDTTQSTRADGFNSIGSNSGGSEIIDVALSEDHSDAISESVSVKSVTTKKVVKSANRKVIKRVNEKVTKKVVKKFTNPAKKKISHLTCERIAVEKLKTGAEISFISQASGVQRSAVVKRVNHNVEDDITSFTTKYLREGVTKKANLKPDEILAPKYNIRPFLK